MKNKLNRHADRLAARRARSRAEREVAFLPVKPRAYGEPKSVVGDLIAKAGGAKEVAHRFGLNVSMIYAFADPASDKDMSFARVASLTGPDNTVAAEYLAHLAGGVFMPVPREGGLMMTLTADLAREVGETVSSIVTSLSDGQMDDSEAEAALKEIDEDLVILMALRAEVLSRFKQRSRP